MSVFRWAELASEPEHLRYSVLSHLLNEKGFKNEFCELQVDPAGLSDALEKARTEYQCLRVGAPFCEPVLQNLARQPVLMAMLKACDCLRLQDGEWWPENLLHEALQTLLAEEHPRLDLKSAVLVVGAGAAARSIVAAVLKLGFARVHLTARNESKGRALVDDFARTYFNAKFSFFPPSHLNSLPGIHSVVINTTPARSDNEILEQLYYFNYLEASGMVIDANTFPLETVLAQEALQAGAHVISGYQMACYVDVLWCERVLGARIPLNDYRSRLKKAFVEADQKPAASLPSEKKSQT